MKKHLFIIVLFTLFLTGFQSIYCQEKIDDSIAEAIQAVHKADMQGDFKLYMESHAFFERVINMDADNYLAKYYLAYLEYRLFQFKQRNTKVDVDKYYDTAVELCNNLIDKKKYVSDAETILAGLYMMRLSSNQMEAMTLFPKIEELLTDAESAPENNPRPCIIRGTMQLYTPEAFGGSVDKAIESYTKAIALFEKAKKNDSIYWGYEESLAWLGQAYAKKNMPDKAKELYTKVLKLEPEYRWVKYVLLSALEKEKQN
jgi:tetratricopeptide (TPR) repeat protein